MQVITVFLILLNFQELFAEPENCDFFISFGRNLISSLLLNAQRVRVHIYV